MIHLASQSATRRRMLEAAGVPFEVVAAPLDEEAEKARLRALDIDAADLALSLAEAKARSVEGVPGFVLGADQVLEQEGGAMLDKPASRAEAQEQLLALSGRTHRLHSAAAVVAEGALLWRTVETVELTMRPLGPDFLNAYLDAEYEAIRWSVGGYRIEGLGAQLFTRIEGSHFAVLGLPLLPLLGWLRAQGMMTS